MTAIVHAPAAGVSAGRSISFAGWLARLAEWNETRRQRAALARLTPDQLRDIGLDVEAAAQEASRPFWDAPAGWR